MAWLPSDSEVEEVQTVNPATRVGTEKGRGTNRFNAVTTPAPQPQPDQPSKGQSFFRGVGEGATLGWQDEIEGAINGGLEYGVRKIRSVATGETVPALSDIYVQARDRSRAKTTGARDANPNTFTTGEVAGAVATSAVPVAGVARAAQAVGTVGKVARAAAVGAGYGGVAGAGKSEGETVGQVASDAAEGATTGALTGGLIQGAGSAIAKTLQSLPAAARGKFIEDLANKAGLPESVKTTLSIAAGYHSGGTTLALQVAKALGATPTGQKVLGEIAKVGKPIETIAAPATAQVTNITKTANKQWVPADTEAEDFTPSSTPTQPQQKWTPSDSDVETVAPAAKAKPKADLDRHVASVEDKYELPVGLLAALKDRGERSRSDSVSPKGAQGVFQFMPATWKQYGNGDPRDDYASTEAAGKFMRDLIDQYGGDVRAAIAHYNGGYSQGRRVARGQEPSFKETRDYLNRVVGTSQQA